MRSTLWWLSVLEDILRGFKKSCRKFCGQSQKCGDVWGLGDVVLSIGCLRWYMCSPHPYIHVSSWVLFGHQTRMRSNINGFPEPNTLSH